MSKPKVGNLSQTDQIVEARSKIGGAATNVGLEHLFQRQVSEEQAVAEVSCGDHS